MSVCLHGNDSMYRVGFQHFHVRVFTLDSPHFPVREFTLKFQHFHVYVFTLDTGCSVT